LRPGASHTDACRQIGAQSVLTLREHSAKRGCLPEFRATIASIGINPYVLVPAVHLRALFAAAGRDKGPIPIRVTIAGTAFEQNLVRYQGEWRLYLNGPMRKAAGKEVGERIALGVEFDAAPRAEPMAPLLAGALAAQPAARAAFDALAPSRRKEILRYLNRAKSPATLQRNVDEVLHYLRGGPARLAVLMSRTPTAKKRSATKRR
jgi:hypothetical protein